jgi:hypothetical protein
LFSPLCFDFAILFHSSLLPRTYLADASAWAVCRAGRATVDDDISTVAAWQRQQVKNMIYLSWPPTIHHVEWAANIPALPSTATVECMAVIHDHSLVAATWYTLRASLRWHQHQCSPYMLTGLATCLNSYIQLAGNAGIQAAATAPSQQSL